MLRAMSDSPVLELHRGGLDPANIARVEDEAARILRELVDSLPMTDSLRHPADLIAAALELRVGRRDFQARRAERKAHLVRHLGQAYGDDPA
jgi:hypothetical protein